MSSIRLAVDLQDGCPVHDPVQERHRQRRITQVVPPGGEVDVRHQRRRTLPAAGVDDLVQQVGRLRRGAPFDLLEAELVDPQQIEATAFAWLAKQALDGRPGNLPSVTGARGLRVLGTVYPA